MKWRSFEINGQEWRIFLVDRRHRFLRKDADGGPYVGRTLYRPRHVYVRKDLDEFELRATLVHELLHVANPRWPVGVEEPIVRVIEKPLTHILQQLFTGWPE